MNILPSVTEEEIRHLLRRESIRYKEQGYGFCFAFAQLLLLVIYLPELGKLIWPYLLAFEIEAAWLELLSLLFVSVGAMIVPNFFYFFIYYL